MPYTIDSGSPKKSLIEIPFQWINDDAPYFIFEKNFSPVGSVRISSTKAAFETWEQEFEGHYRFGSCFVLCFHPQLLSAGRMLNLERLIHHMKNRGNVWFARMSEIAEHYASNSG